MKQIVISDHLPDSGWEILRKTENIAVSGPFSSRKALLEALPGAHALIVRSGTQVDVDLMDHAPQLQVIARAGARIDNIDLDEATRRGIMVIRVQDANIQAVAELTFGLLIALARKIPYGVQSLSSGRWERFALTGFQLYEKTIGVIGYGHLGQEVAARARAFGMQVLAYDPGIDLSLARERGVEVVGLEELLRRSDVVTPQIMLTPRTYHILDAAAFSHMKPGSYLVNCTYPGLIDEEALLHALDSGKLAGAALDSFEEEPPRQGHPLVNHPRVLALPHINQNTVESQDTTGKQIVRDVLDALHNRDYRNVANLPFNEVIPYAAVRPYILLASKLGKLQGQLSEGWITRVEVELLGEGLLDLVRPVAAVLLTGMLRPVEGRRPNWISAPVLAFEQGILTAQVKNLLDQADYPNLLICRIEWEGGGSRTVAGVLFANGEARLVRYNDFQVDAHPEGYVLILENEDVPGVIGKVGRMLGDAGINIANWRYGRETRGGRAVSFINIDSRIEQNVLEELVSQPEITRARLVHL
jgi:D-3-phosphoglycerate dehydrogenase